MAAAMDEDNAGKIQAGRLKDRRVRRREQGGFCPPQVFSLGISA